MDTGRTPTATIPRKDSIIKPYKLSHGTLMCGDLQKSRQFYEEFLGLEVVRHTKPAMMFRLVTGMHVAAVECSPDKLWDMHVLHHWGIDVATPEEVDDAHKKAQEHREKYGSASSHNPSISMASIRSTCRIATKAGGRSSMRHTNTKRVSHVATSYRWSEPGLAIRRRVPFSW